MNLHRSVLTLAIGVALSSAACAGQTADAAMRSDLESVWEVLWHQSGMPTTVAKWSDKELRVAITGLNPERHEAVILAAFARTTEAAGFELQTVDDPADANVVVQIVANSQMTNHEPCDTHMSVNADESISSMVVKMREGEVARCIPHEAMHVMGLRGHPEGNTVLTYFNEPPAITALDRSMLRAWYSPQMKAGMGPFEAFEILSAQLVCDSAQPDAAFAMRDTFYANAVIAMQAYAIGAGDIPAIIKRSGKSTAAGIQQGRAEMTGFLKTAATGPLSHKLACKSPVNHSAIATTD